MHSLAVCVKDRLSFAWDLSLENSTDSYLCFRLALLHSMSYFFILSGSSSLSLCTVFYSISSNIDEVFSINPSADVFAFRDFNIHYKDWLTYSGGTERSGELCYNFSISNDLTHMVNFPTQIPDWYPQSCPFGFLSFFWCQYLFYIGFPSIGELWSCCCLSFHLIFIKFTMGCPVSLHSLWLFLCWLGWSLWSFERCSIGGYL